MDIRNIEGLWKGKSALVRLTVFLVCAGALVAAYRVTKTEVLMSESAALLIESLDQVQRSYTVFPFDVPHRNEGHYFPENGFTARYGHVRNGITFNQMDSKQAHFANALLGTGLSRHGFVKAKKVMGLEEIVRVIEGDTTGHRDANQFHFTIFGDPSSQGPWGWRVEGHHLSLHYTVKNGKLVSSTPTFFGANPHEVAQGSHKGFRVLDDEEDMAIALLRSLDTEQVKVAIFSDVAPADIITLADARIMLSGKQRRGPAVDLTTEADIHNATIFERRAELDGTPRGIAASKLTDKQYGKLLDLIAVYANNMPQEVAAGRMEVARAVPRGQLYFGWMGRPDRIAPQPVPTGGRTTGNREPNGNYYRIQSPSFLIEYDNTQNQSNHSHSVWRDFENDFGIDILALHYETSDHNQPLIENAD